MLNGLYGFMVSRSVGVWEVPLFCDSQSEGAQIRTMNPTFRV